MLGDVDVLLDLMKRIPLDATLVPQACPVVAFGDWDQSRVATVGINPSDLEFWGRDGQELPEGKRRLHTLASLGLSNWADAQKPHAESVMEACHQYFHVNPYDQWFKPLDGLLSGLGVSFYDKTACHLDLVPFATQTKWGALPTADRKRLIQSCHAVVADCLSRWPVTCLVLNGKTVVRTFETMFGVAFESREMPSWQLRGGSRGVRGFAFEGTLVLPAGKQVRVLGYNHNLQSSFGVTNEVKGLIGQWIASAV